MWCQRFALGCVVDGWVHTPRLLVHLFVYLFTRRLVSGTRAIAGPPMKRPCGSRGRGDVAAGSGGRAGGAGRSCRVGSTASCSQQTSKQQALGATRGDGHKGRGNCQKYFCRALHCSSSAEPERSWCAKIEVTCRREASGRIAIRSLMVVLPFLLPYAGALFTTERLRT